MPLDDNLEPFSSTPRRLGCLHCGSLVVLLLITVGIVGVMALRAFAVKQYGAANIARLKSYDTVILPVPVEWQKPAVLPSPEVVSFQLQFYQTMARLSDRFGQMINVSDTSESLYLKMQREVPLTSEEESQIDHLITAVSPIFEVTSSTIQLPDYTAEMQLYSTGTDFLQIQNFTKFSSIVAMEASRRGDYNFAIPMALLPIRYLQHTKPTSLMFDLIRVIITDSALDTLNVITENCHDITALKQGLHILDEFRDGSKPLEHEALAVTDVISLANRAAAFGYPVNLGPQTRSQLTMQMEDIYGKPYNEWAVNQFSKNDPRHKTAQEILDNIKKQERADSEEGGGSSSIIGIVTRMVFGENLLGVSRGAILSDFAIPDYEIAETRAEVMIAKYDLTRLHLAQRILELQKEQGATATDTITELIPSMPSDPFSSGTLRFRNETNQFYSLGPDKDDDNQSVLYDATNGTFSDGDIFTQKR